MRLLLIVGVVLLLAACAMRPPSARPDWDATPVASDECEIIQSKDLGRIKYCQRGDYAEIFRLD
jgi:hypothetical protein